MALKNLLVAYNGGEASDTALHLGLLMANKFDAHLTGIVAHGASNITRSIPTWMHETVRAQISDLTRHRADELKSRFFERTHGKLSDDRLHWIDIPFDPDSAVSRYSRMFDLTILGQYQNLTAADEYELHPDRIAYNCGRPIFVAPINYRPAVINERAVIAWDGQRASARAFWDAMQLLQTKDEVIIVTVGDEAEAPKFSGIDLKTVLRRHGIHSEHRFIPGKKASVADTLLGVCDDVDAGLLVMGAYQHSKLSEDLFGGITATVLSKAKIPLFISH